MFQVAAAAAAAAAEAAEQFHATCSLSPACALTCNSPHALG